MKKIFLAADHAGLDVKGQIKEILRKRNLDFEDLGPFEYNSLDDYPDFISRVAKKVSNNPEKNIGIILGGSGQGEAIVANRFTNVRAIVYYGGPKEILKLSKEHNNANILSLGARFIKKEEMELIINTWLNELFTNEKRHVQRIKKIEKYSQKKCILF